MLDAAEISCSFPQSFIKNSPVSSYTEWDLLEEVIVGVVDGSSFPPWHISLKPVLPENQHAVFQEKAGQHFPKEHIALANKELEEFVHILEGEGVKVRRPEARN